MEQDGPKSTVEAPAPRGSVMSDPERPRILLVDGHAAIGEAVAADLRAYGFTVLHAPDVASAVALAGTHPLDLVLLHLAPPDGDHARVLRAIRASVADLPVIALTEPNGAGSAFSGPEAGFD